MEIERKYRLIEPAAMEAKLRLAGFQSEGAHFEANSVYDTPDFELYRSGALLRLRIQEWADRRACILTFKGPANERAAREAHLKMREELETAVGEPEMAALILVRLGYERIAQYEKIRSEWRSPAEPGMAVDLDYLPFGAFIELEGKPAAIRRLECALGLDKSEIGLKTYHELNQEWRNSNGLPFSRDFVFDAAERHRLRKQLGLA